MIIGKLYNHAMADYYCNVNGFIKTGEGLELTRFQSLNVSRKYPKVEQWYKNLDLARRKRIGILEE